MSKLHKVVALAATITVAGVLTAIAMSASTATTTNLLANGGAQDGGSGGWSPGGAAANDECSGASLKLHNKKYSYNNAANGGFVPATPQSVFGNKLFVANNAAGDSAYHCMSQVVDLRPHHHLLASPHAHYTASGWFGAKDASIDAPHGWVCFFDGSMNEMGNCKIIGNEFNPGGTADKLVLQVRSAAINHPVPSFAQFTVVSHNDDGGRNTGTADNLSFTLSNDP